MYREDTDIAGYVITNEPELFDIDEAQLIAGDLNRADKKRNSYTALSHASGDAVIMVVGWRGACGYVKRG